MPNSPPSVYVVKLTGAGNVQVFPLLPTQLLGAQDGSDVGTGGPGLATLESAALAGTFHHSRMSEFLDDTYVLVAPTSSFTNGVYKRAQGGAGLWGRVTGGGVSYDNDGSCSGLHVLHPAGVPTLMVLVFDILSEIRLFYTIDGTSGVNWGITAGQVLETNGGGPTTYGHSITFRDSIFWVHNHFAGGNGNGAITQWDHNLQVMTRYDVSALLDSLNRGAAYAFHVHDNVVFLFGWGLVGVKTATLLKLQAGSFVSVSANAGQVAAPGLVGTANGHSVLFTDDATGDLITIMSGVRASNSAPRALVERVQGATGSPVVTDISTTIMGAVEGADKYLEGGGSANVDRRWVVYVDNDADPLNPRTFLWTWIPGGVTECWEWKGIAAEMQAVASLAGVADDFSLPFALFGGGERSILGSRIEVGDPANQDVEASGGRKFFFRAIGTGGPNVGTFYVSSTEGVPNTLVPIVAASFVVESGAPASTPLIVGNTLTNITPDNGTVLYSIVLNLSAVSIGSGAPGRLIGDLV